MFSKIYSLAILATFAATSTAIAIPSPQWGTSTNQCNTGPAQCCNIVDEPTAAGLAAILGLVGIEVGSLSALVGVNCNPISVIGDGAAASCPQQPICCQNNGFGGLVALGCSPIDVNFN